MDISSITQAQQTQTASASTGKSQMGKDDFLRLLTVQLQYQDPMDPMDNKEFIAQMAQFTSLEQLQNMNKSLEQSLTSSTELKSAMAADRATSLVGRSVEVPVTSIAWDGSHSTDMTYQVADGTAQAKLQVTDALGRVVRSYDLRAGSSYGAVAWDGRSTDGVSVPAGDYRVAVVGQSASGASVSGRVLQRGKVDAVRYTADQTSLTVSGRQVSLTDLGGVVADN